MKKMATIKNFTSLEQSKVLDKILPIESADMDYIPAVNIDGEYSIYVNEWDNEHAIGEGWIPCWSLTALLNVLAFPALSKDNIGKDKIGWMVSVYPDNCRYDSDWYDNPIDACYEMILKLHKDKML